MKQTKITFNLKGLKDFQQAVGADYRTRVGIIGDKVGRKNQLAGETLTNAEIGVIQQFGSYSRKIPPRDFLLMPIQKHRRQIITVMQSSVVRAAMNAGDYKKVYALLGIAAEAFVKMAFGTSGWGQWAPNKASTIARKGSSKPLIDTGELSKAIASDVVKKGKTSSGIANVSATGGI